MARVNSKYYFVDILPDKVPNCFSGNVFSIDGCNEIASIDISDDVHIYFSIGVDTFNRDHFMDLTMLLFKVSSVAPVK